MPQATCRFRVWLLRVWAHEGAREIHKRSRACKCLLFARDRCIIAYCYCLHLTLGWIFPWILYLQDQQKTHEGPLHEQQLLHIVDDLCRFILYEVVHIDGEFVHPDYELSTVPKYASLRQWDNQALRAGNSSVSQYKWSLYSNDALWLCLYSNDMHCNDTFIWFYVEFVISYV